jgi:hypothetical protein
MLIALAGVLFCVYYFFIRHDPQKDAKKAAIMACDCSGKYTDVLMKMNEEFLSSFSSYNFKSKQDARNKLQELQNRANVLNSECATKSQNTFNKARSNFLSNQNALSKFDLTYNNQLAICIPANQGNLTSISLEVESKIASIIDPEPDSEKIKSDLIGQQMLGWNFDALSEFKKFTISNITRNTTRIEYLIDISLAGITNPATDLHEANILVTYLFSDNTLYFSDVKNVFITYIYTAPINEWLSIRPLQNSSYSIINDGQKFWVRDGMYGSKYKGGGDDTESYHLTSPEIYLMSREDQPVSITFKYIPSN